MKDPLEKNNLAAVPKYAKLLDKLRKQCEETAMKYQSEKLCPDDPFMELVYFKELPIFPFQDMKVIYWNTKKGLVLICVFMIPMLDYQLVQ